LQGKEIFVVKKGKNSKKKNIGGKKTKIDEGGRATKIARVLGMGSKTKTPSGNIPEKAHHGKYRGTKTNRLGKCCGCGKESGSGSKTGGGKFTGKRSIKKQKRRKKTFPLFDLTPGGNEKGKGARKGTKKTAIPKKESGVWIEVEGEEGCWLWSEVGWDFGKDGRGRTQEKGHKGPLGGKGIILNNRGGGNLLL